MIDAELIIKRAEDIGVTLTKKQGELLSKFAACVAEENKKFNLTAITDENEFLDKHIIDSLSGISEILSGSSLLDIGAGAGFPSVPIAIAREDVSVTALDSTAKKMTFVSDAAKELGVSNLSAIVGRAEELSVQKKFDTVCARAVSSLPVLLEISCRLLKTGGRFIAYKTDESELVTCENACKTLRYKHLHTKFLTLPNGDRRAILVFEKTDNSPSVYPRQYGVIKKRPL